MYDAYLTSMAKRGSFDRRVISSLGEGTCFPQPRHNEVVVFREFFVADLLFPLDPMVVDILRLYGIFYHQLMPNTMLSLYFWLTKAYRSAPSAKGFTHAYTMHYQSKTVLV